MRSTKLSKRRNAMPIHAAVGHLVVVLAPLTAVMAFGYAAVPGLRRGLRWPLIGGSASSLGLAVWAGEVGGDLLTELEAAAGGSLPAQVGHHAKGSDALGVALAVLTTVVVVVCWRYLPPGRTGTSRRPAVILTAAGAMVLVTAATVLTQAMQAMWATHLWWTP